MKRNYVNIIGTLAVLMLVGIVSVPVMAVASGSIVWNSSHYQKGDTGSYTYACAGVAKCIINVSAPSGYGYVYNGTNTSATGVGTQVLSYPGTYTAYVLNGVTELDSDTTAVSLVAGVIEVIVAITGTVVPSVVELAVAVVPLIVVGALVVFLGGFFETLLGKIR